MTGTRNGGDERKSSEISTMGMESGGSDCPQGNFRIPPVPVVVAHGKEDLAMQTVTKKTDAPQVLGGSNQPLRPPPVSSKDVSISAFPNSAGPSNAGVKSGKKTSHSSSCLLPSKAKRILSGDEFFPGLLLTSHGGHECRHKY